jgi:hypothetical protein
MEACPKCNFSLAPGAQECPACGLVLAKFKTASVIPVQPLVQNPYVPPRADVENVPPPPPVMAPRPQPVITPATLAALEQARPWISLIVGYGFVILALMLVAAAGLLFGASEQDGLVPMAIAYFLYGLVGFAVLLPLRRSREAIRDLSTLDSSASMGVEAFAIEQAQFWRRIGLLTVVSMVLMILLVGVAGAGILSLLE